MGKPDNLELVVFDLDGTVLDTEAMRFACYTQVMGEWGLPFSRETYLGMIGLTREEDLLLFARLYGPGVDLARLYARYDELERAATEAGPPLKPGYRALVEGLHARGVDICIASSTPREKVLHCLRSAGILGDFSLVACGDEVPRTKPAPDVYLRVLARRGVDAGRAAAVEDSPVGLRAAKAAGLWTVLVPDMLPPDAGALALADACVESLHEVLGVL